MAVPSDFTGDQKSDILWRHSALGLMWASVCAAILKRFLAHAAQRVGPRIAISTRRVAMCAHHMLEALVTALLIGIGLLGALRRGLAYLLANARRPNLERDRRTGRLRAGLTLVEATKSFDAQIRQRICALRT